MRFSATRLLVATLILAGTFGLGGCKSKTADDRVEEAYDLLEQNQIPLAVVRLKDVVNEHPEEPAAIEARFLLANIELQIGRRANLQNALEHLQAIQNQVGLNDERGLEALQAAAQVHLQLEQYEEALALLHDAREKVQEPQAKQQLDMLYHGLLLQAEEEERQQTAIDYFYETAMTADEPGLRGHAREILADFHRRNERYDESTKIYEDYMERYPEDEVNPQLIMAQALNYRLAGEMERSEELFEKGAAQMLQQIEEELNIEERTRRLQDMARLYETIGRLDDAEAMLRRIMAEQPGRVPALNAQVAIGEMYARHGQWDRAIEIFSQIASENAGTQIADNAQNMIKRIEAAREAQQQAAQEPGEETTEAPAQESDEASAETE